MTKPLPQLRFQKRCGCGQPAATVKTIRRYRAQGRLEPLWAAHFVPRLDMRPPGAVVRPPHGSVFGRAVLPPPRSFARRRFRPGARTVGSWSWSYDGEDHPFATIVYEADLTEEGDAWLRLRYQANGEPLDYRIRLVTTIPNYGGRRWWFICPLSALEYRPLAFDCLNGWSRQKAPRRAREGVGSFWCLTAYATAPAAWRCWRRCAGASSRVRRCSRAPGAALSDPAGCGACFPSQQHPQS